jgi:hypothetical protein
VDKRQETMEQQDLVFISYAREDKSWAERLYMDLRKQHINAWLDVKCLKAGANWKLAIPKAIREARYFLLLLSRHSVTKRGYVQREIREGLEVLKEFPRGEIFMIPVKLDATDPVDPELHDLNWVPIFPDYHDGLARILSVLSTLQKSPLLVVTAAGSVPTAPIKVIDKGREIDVDFPLILGARAAISYAPFRTAQEFLQQFFDRLPGDSLFADRNLSYYLTISTVHPDLRLGEDLLKQFPERMVLVLQNAFHELQVHERGVSVSLAFSGQPRLVAIPFEAIVGIDMPEIGVRISIDPDRGRAT